MRTFSIQPQQNSLDYYRYQHLLPIYAKSRDEQPKHKAGKGQYSIAGYRIHLHSRNGQYLVLGYSELGIYLTTNKWLTQLQRDEEAGMKEMVSHYYIFVPYSDYKCTARNYDYTCQSDLDDFIELLGLQGLQTTAY